MYVCMYIWDPKAARHHAPHANASKTAVLCTLFHCYCPGKPAWINSNMLCSALQDGAFGWTLLKLDGRSLTKQIKPEDVFLTCVLFFSAARGSLQPWSQGVIAVVVFLVLVAIAFVVNRFWCKEKV